MKPEVIFLIILLVAIVALIAFVIISFNKKKQAVVTTGLKDGTITGDDVCLTGTFRMSAGEIAKETAKAVAKGVVGAIFGVGVTSTVRPKQMVMVLGKERINIFIETSGAFVNSFKNNILLPKDLIENISVDRQFKNNLSISIALNDGHLIQCTVKPFKKEEGLSKTFEIINSFSENRPPVNPV